MYFTTDLITEGSPDIFKDTSWGIVNFWNTVLQTTADGKHAIKWRICNNLTSEFSFMQLDKVHTEEHVNAQSITAEASRNSGSSLPNRVRHERIGMSKEDKVSISQCDSNLNLLAWNNCLHIYVNSWSLETMILWTHMLRTFFSILPPTLRIKYIELNVHEDVPGLSFLKLEFIRI